MLKCPLHIMGFSETKSILITPKPLALKDVEDFAFRQNSSPLVKISEETFTRVEASQKQLLKHLEIQTPLYGVTTGFGDSCFRVITNGNTEKLQHNLVQYLLAGSGKSLPVEAVRATFLIRLNSLCRGFSGVSRELIERMVIFLNNDWIPVVPARGSLGASGDLIPLAYIAQALQGEGELHTPQGVRKTSEVLQENDTTSYVFKAKEALALVNGTSMMAGMAIYNLKHARHILEQAELATSWMVLALKGRKEAFGQLVNESAQHHRGQRVVAQNVTQLINEENYATLNFKDIEVKDSTTSTLVQDRYSIRCTPQVLGPVHDTIELVHAWVEEEINAATDNPLISPDGEIATGGNFYGGYLSQGMDYLKISLAQIADLMDRQLTLLVDEKSNRGLPPNLAAWNSISENERFLHHGFKGLHQATSAITSELMSKTIPNSIFSRSSESHNQDKVSLGMTAAVQCEEMFLPLQTVLTMHLMCLTQALDLRGVQLRGEISKKMYTRIREVLPFIEHDQRLDKHIQVLSQELHGTI